MQIIDKLGGYKKVKEILDKNGGRIDIKSVVGKGTEVVVTIPTKENTIN